MSLIEAVRRHSIRINMQSTFLRAWDVLYRDAIKIRLGKNPDRKKVLRISEQLSEIVELGKDVPALESKSENKDQGNRSIVGNAWERLCSWYINAASYGTNCVSFSGSSRSKLLPVSFLNAFKMKIGNDTVKSDLDCVIINFGKDLEIPEMDYDAPLAQVKREFSKLLEENYQSISVTILSCKTNWSDMVQTPLLMSIIYDPHTVTNKVSVGLGQMSPKGLGHFSYAFMTMPSEKDPGKGAWRKYKRSSLAVVRVSGFSGGCYWGRKRNEKILMEPLSEIFSDRNRLPTGTIVGSRFANDYCNEELASTFCLL